MVIYVDNSLREHTIYGSGRIGVYNRGANNDIFNYQLTDHLGNVRAVIQKQPSGNALALIARKDYYPFGMPMPERNDETTEYRYAFQGQEKDPETGMEAFGMVG
jgi:hypothetical protein